LAIPFTDAVINLGPLYIPIMTFIIIGIVNAVNLTDGLDGLASGVTLIVAAFFMIYAGNIGNTDVAVLAAATVGACLGFLGFNSYPAKIFMGDTGSMALGGAVVAFAVLTNSILIIPLVGGIYFAEAISVIMQVSYYKLTKKRIFKMAPIHHHFEQCGWPETRVVFVFWIVTVVLAWISIIAVF
ncbi:phospho-N-acetylmuramoyl-pentapeptide-transferase, partial [Romboutsia weinsteinii]